MVQQEPVGDATWTGGGEPPLERLRIPFVHKARLSHGGQKEELFVLDIALRGVFVERAEPLPVGTNVDLEMALPGNEIPLRARCRVAWVHAGGEKLHTKTLPTGVGLEFLEASVGDFTRVKDLLEAYCLQNPQARRFLRHWPEEVRGDDPLGEE